MPEPPNDEAVDRLLCELDSIARDFDPSVFGLPLVFDEHRGRLREAVRRWAATTRGEPTASDLLAQAERAAIREAAARFVPPDPGLADMVVGIVAEARRRRDARLAALLSEAGADAERHYLAYLPNSLRGHSPRRIGDDTVYVVPRSYAGLLTHEDLRRFPHADLGIDVRGGSPMEPPADAT